MTLKEQACKSGLFLSEERVEWNENDWPSLEGLEGGFRAFHASVVLDHTVVVMGGVKQEGATNSVLVLNLAERNKQWRVGPPMNKSRNGLAAVGCNGGIYVMGGYNGNTLDCIEQINASDLLEQSSTSSSTHESHWTTLNCRLSTRRNGCCAVVVHNRYCSIQVDDHYKTTQYLHTMTVSLCFSKRLSIMKDVQSHRSASSSLLKIHFRHCGNKHQVGRIFISLLLHNHSLPYLGVLGCCPDRNPTS